MVTFAQSAFPPLALGFFGLGTGYLIYGPQELFGWPRRDNPVDRGTGIWGIWLPGFCQLVTGLILFVGLTWLQVFTDTPPLYMAALAFSAYGIHWFAIYFSDFFASIGMNVGERALGLFHLATGGWLMYLAYAVAVDFSIGYHWRV